MPPGGDAAVEDPGVCLSVDSDRRLESETNAVTERCMTKEKVENQTSMKDTNPP